MARRRMAAGLAALGMTVGLAPQLAAAHPLGNFTINRYSRLTTAGAGLALRYVVDMAEIPTFTERQTMDANGDGTVSQPEADTYLAQEARRIAAALVLEVGGRRQALRVSEQQLAFASGQGGLLTARLVLDLATPPLPTGAALTVAYHDTAFEGRPGWQEVVVRAGASGSLLASDAPALDQSAELTNYPAALAMRPPARDTAHARVLLQPGGSAGAETGRATSSVPGYRPLPGDQGTALTQVLRQSDMSLAALLAALGAAFVWGGAHALTPGHGKTVVAAYLVGSRGTARHAAFLGLTTTITHTAGVLALGAVTLLASRWILPEQMFPWLGTLSGLLVVGLGITMLRSRLAGARRRQGVGEEAHGHGHHGHARHEHDQHDHDHQHHGPHGHEHGQPHGLDHGQPREHPHPQQGRHNHLPPGADGASITLRSLLALGVSGGLLPCPSALVLMLGAIALGRVALGLALVMAFSVGLAAVLTGVGLAMVFAGRLLGRLPALRRPQLAYLPVASALLVTLAGLAITAQALAETGVAPRLALLWLR